MAVTTQALYGNDGSIAATWVHSSPHESFLYGGTGNGAQLGTVTAVTIGSGELDWVGHVIGDRRQSGVLATREGAMAYVVNRCQQKGSVPFPL